MSIRIILASKLFKDSLFFINIFINIGKPSDSHFLLSKLGTFDRIQYETKQGRPSVTS